MYNYDDMENYYTLYRLSQMGEYKITRSGVLFSKQFELDPKLNPVKDSEFKLDDKLNQ